MKLFRKRAVQPQAPQTREAPVATAPTAAPRLAPHAPSIVLTAEQKALLQTPVDPRVERILQEIYADRAAAERALKSRRIIEFPLGDSGERRVIQDENGFWRIVLVAGESQRAQLGDIL
ncbi:MAG TPA: hypothetical protein VE758_04690 [Chthoniobacterales bacterium]|nr:hypothetical protein [Chthoniobacterales bacterium]